MFDNYSTEHHLTPDGWVYGTSRYFGNVQGEEVERLQNAVETWEHRVTQASGWSREDHRTRRLWYKDHFRRVSARLFTLSLNVHSRWNEQL